MFGVDFSKAIARGAAVLACFFPVIAHASGQSAGAAGSCGARIPFGFYDPKGRVPQEISIGGIRVRDKAIRVIGGAIGSDERRVILLLDLSTSMKQDFSVPGGDIAQQTRQAAKLFLKTMRPGDWAALHVFATNHKVVVPMTQNLAAVLQAVDRLPLPGSPEARAMTGTASSLDIAAKEVIRSESANPQPGGVVLLVSDGMYQVPPPLIPELADDFTRNGIRLFLVRVGPIQDQRVRRYLLAVSQMTIETGGMTLDTWKTKTQSYKPEPPTEERLRDAVQLAYQMMGARHWLELEFARCDGKRKKIELELRDEKTGARLKDVILFYPHYVVPSTTRDAQAQR